MYKPLLLKILKIIILISTIICLYYVVTSAILYIYPFICAVILSLFINPIVTFLHEKVKIPRFLATIITLMFIFLFIVGIVFLIIAEVLQGTAYLAEQIPHHFVHLMAAIDLLFVEKISPLFDKLATLFNTLDPAQQRKILEELETFIEFIATSGASLLKNFFLKIPSFLSVIPHSMTIIFFMLLATVFITKDWYSLQEICNTYVPASIRRYGTELSIHFKDAILGYMKGQLLLICISSIIILIGLWIMNIKHALTIVLFAAIIDALPLVGTGIIFIPWIVYLFLTGHFPMTIHLSVLFMIVTIVRQLIEPKVLSSSIGVNPLLSLVVLYVSFQLWGITGVFLAPVILVLLYVCHEAKMFHRLWAFINEQ
ncbi:MAG TPA: sporulation integral membrane protein YtvI [Bacillota bacterium]